MYKILVSTTFADSSPDTNSVSASVHTVVVEFAARADADRASQAVEAVPVREGYWLTFKAVKLY